MVCHGSGRQGDFLLKDQGFLLEVGEQVDLLKYLFLEFLEMYKRGEGVRIIDRMNALRICVFT